LVEHATENRSVAGSIPALGTITLPHHRMNAAAAPDAVSIRGVTKSFGGLRAVQDVSLHVAPGEFFSLLGPSGCGKTTLMRIIAGFETPETGSLLIDGEDMAGVPPHLRPVNMMFQSYALFPHLTVAGNIAFGLKQQGLDRQTMQRRLDEMLALVQLDGLADRKPHQLSGGQRQRVALARALARAPKVLLLDEPLGALDKKLRQETQGELKRIQATSGTTFIVVTHDQEEAMALSDRIAVMREGRIVQVGAPETVYDRPADLYVAGFIGEINRLDAEVAADDATAAVLRPECLSLSAERHDGADRWIEARVVERTPLGPNVAYRLRTTSGGDLKALAPSQGDGAGHRVGAAVWAGFKLADLRVLGA
jgi:putrescine transport system ATP-binding protein